MVLQWLARPVVSNEEAEDRAVVHQRLAVLCARQRQTRPRWADFVAPHAIPRLRLEQLRIG